MRLYTLLSLVLLFVQANAQTFPCDGRIFLVQNDGAAPTDLVEIKYDTGVAQFIPIAEYESVGLSGVGYNPMDGFLYGFNRDDNGIYRIISIDSVQLLGFDPSLTPGNVGGGDVTLDGYLILQDGTKSILHYYKVINGFQKIAEIPLFWDPNSVNSGVADFNMGDMVVDPSDPSVIISFQHFLQAPTTTNGFIHYINIDLNSPNVGMVTPGFRLNPAHLDIMGAMFVNMEGDIMGYGGPTGNGLQNRLLLIDQVNKTSQLVAFGPSSLKADGCSCPRIVDLLCTVDSIDRQCDSSIVKFDLILDNKSMYPKASLEVADTLPVGGRILSISTPTQGVSYQQISERIVQFKVDTLFGMDSIMFSMSVRVSNQHFPYGNKAYITNYWEGSDIQIESDDPATTAFNDTTFIDIPGIENEVTFSSSIDTLIFPGDQIDLYGSTFSDTGFYEIRSSSSMGCDTVIELTIRHWASALHYSFDSCRSFRSDGSDMNYDDMTPTMVNGPLCFDLSASTAYRQNPPDNKHSCTPGVDGDIAMCVSSLDSCDYVPGHERSIIIDFEISPDQDKSVRFGGFSFFERSPERFDWIRGPDGLNNYPLYFGVRVLRDGREIFREARIASTRDWSQVRIEMMQNDDFLVEEASEFTLEVLPYCLVGNASQVTAWDIDELSVFMACTDRESKTVTIPGRVTTPRGVSVEGGVVRAISKGGIEEEFLATSDEEGFYALRVPVGEPLSVDGYVLDEYLNGVSVLDYSLIKKHLLGIRDFDQAYQYIAADLDKNGQVSIADVSHLRKLLLGIKDRMPKKESWEIGNWIEEERPFDFYIPITLRQEHVEGLDLLAIKTGDVSGNASLKEQGIETRNEKVHLHSIEAELRPGEVVTIPIYFDQEAILEGLDLSFYLAGWNGLTLVPGSAPIRPSDYVIHDGKINLVMAEKIIADPEVPLFFIQGRADRNGRLSDHLKLDPASSHWYVEDDALGRIIGLSIGKTQVGTADVKVWPNPSQGNFYVSFTKPTEGSLTYRVLNLYGTTIMKGVMEKGQAQVSLPQDIPPGWYILVIGEGRNQTKTFIGVVG